MKNIINHLIGIASVFMFIDAVGFVMWAMSGQHPVDGYYIGVITTTIIKSIVSLI